MVQVFLGSLQASLPTKLLGTLQVFLGSLYVSFFIGPRLDARPPRYAASLPRLAVRPGFLGLLGLQERRLRLIASLNQRYQIFLSLLINCYVVHADICTYIYRAFIIESTSSTLIIWWNLSNESNVWACRPPRCWNWFTSTCAVTLRSLLKTLITWFNFMH